MIKTSKRSGFSLAELLITTALMALVIGTLSSLYFFAIDRTTRGLTETAALLQAQELLDRMEHVVAQATDCSVQTNAGQIGLKCRMPLSGTDKDGDGILDTYTPNSVSRRQIAKYTQGLRVWFYQADATGNFGVAGTIVYQAARNDDVYPVGANTKAGFTNTGGNMYRWNLVDSVTYTVDTPPESATITVRTSSLTRRGTAAGATTAETRDNYVVNLSRQVCWRNWWR